MLAHTSKSAANYISDISKERWVSFSVFEKFGIHSHGYKTNWQVEQVSWRPLFMSPPLLGFSPSLFTGEREICRGSYTLSD